MQRNSLKSCKRIENGKDIELFNASYNQMAIKISISHDWIRYTGGSKHNAFTTDLRNSDFVLGPLEERSFRLLNCVESLLKMYDQNRFADGQKRITQAYLTDMGETAYIYCERKKHQDKYQAMLLGVEYAGQEFSAILTQPVIFQLQGAITKAKNWISPETWAWERSYIE